MSLVQTLKKAEARIIELEKMLADEKDARAADISGHTEKIKGLEDKLKAEKDAAAEYKTEAEEAREGLNAKLKESFEKYGKLEQDNKDVKGELEKAKAALKNPAFADASVIGRENAVKGDGDGDDGDSTAKGQQAQESFWDQYNAITDPVKQTVFWNAHEKELKEEQRKIAEAEQN